MVRRGQMYDDDDAYDYDDDYYEDYEDYDDEPAQPTQPAKSATKAPAAGTGTPKAPASAAGASALARYICDPPPLAPKGKPQPGAKPEPAAKAKHQASYPVTPPPGFTNAHSRAATAQHPGSATSRPPPGFAPAAQPPQPFDFQTPSPDATVLAAQARQGNSSDATDKPQSASKASAPTTPNFITLAPSKAMLASNQQQLQQQQQQQSSAGTTRAASTGLSSAMAGVSLSRDNSVEAAAINGSSASAQTGSHVANLTERKRMSEFTQEPALARECAAAAEAETSASTSIGGGSGSGKLGLHLVVLGHVDAGKSTLMGRLLHDLGLVSQKEVHKNQRDAAAAGKASFSWAWLLDERPEERARGVTVDVATARFVTPRYNVTLLDAPGHKDFVPNMISGASQADAAVLVVDGSPGGFEAGFEGSGAAGASHGQTREHAQLARSLGVEQLVVVISKLDLADYDPLRFASIQSQLSPFLSTCGFKETSVQWLPAVGPTGENLTQAPGQDSGLSQWWQGPTLVQAIDTFKPRERLTGKPVRLPVTDVYRNKAGVSVVGGKLESGALKPGSKLVLMPGSEPVTVKAMEVAGHSTNLSRAGDSVELQLITGPSLDLSHLPTGAVLCGLEFPVPVVTRFQARILMLEVPVPLLPGRSVTVHAHVAREAGVVTSLVALLNARTGETVKSKPRCLLKGQTGVVEILLDRALCLEEYSDLKALGRVALRDGGKTLAVGVVTQLLQ